MDKFYFQEELPTFCTGYRKILFNDQFNMPHVFILRYHDIQRYIAKGQECAGRCFSYAYQAEVISEMDKVLNTQDPSFTTGLEKGKAQSYNEQEQEQEQDFVSNPTL